MAALEMAFAINFLLLFYRVTVMMVEVLDEEAAAMESAAAEEECEVEEIISMNETDSYLELALKLLALVHSLTSFSTLIAYYCLKVTSLWSLDCCVLSALIVANTCDIL